MRGSERVEGAMVMLAVLVALLAVPIAAALGTAAYSSEATAIRAERASRRVVDAVVVDVPRKVVGERRTATVRWRDGERVRTATAPIGTLAGEGDHLDVWIGADGSLTEAPRGSDAAPMTGVAVGMIVMAMVIGGGFVSVESARLWCARRNGLGWEREWRRFDTTAQG